MNCNIYIVLCSGVTINTCKKNPQIWESTRSINSLLVCFPPSLSLFRATEMMNEPTKWEAFIKVPSALFKAAAADAEKRGGKTTRPTVSPYINLVPEWHSNIGDLGSE